MFQIKLHPPRLVSRCKLLRLPRHASDRQHTDPLISPTSPERKALAQAVTTRPASGWKQVAHDRCVVPNIRRRRKRTAFFRQLLCQGSTHKATCRMGSGHTNTVFRTYDPHQAQKLIVKLMKVSPGWEVLQSISDPPNRQPKRRQLHKEFCKACERISTEPKAIGAPLQACPSMSQQEAHCRQVWSRTGGRICSLRYREQAVWPPGAYVDGEGHAHAPHVVHC